jgi:TonB-dependent receptor
MEHSQSRATGAARARLCKPRLAISPGVLCAATGLGPVRWRLAMLLWLLTVAAPALADPQSTAATQSDHSDSTTDQAIQQVVVLGVRGAEEQATEIKRAAAVIQDSISAEDIGKLPDTTIADSLQRITGVQIDRVGGEGTSINIRGLPQVGTNLNGEAFLTADTIDSVQPNFNTIPSQLFAGADVIKTATSDLLDSGITGTVNLRTRRPLELKEGLTVALSADGTHGSVTDQWQPETSGLIAFRGARWGAMLSGSYSDVTTNASTSGMDQYGGELFGENAASTSGNGFLGAWAGAPIPSAIQQLGGGNVSVTGNGQSNAAFYGSENFTAFNQHIERQRLGLNGSIQGELGNGFRLTGDFFYTDQKQYARESGYQLNSLDWEGATFVPQSYTPTGVTVTGPYNGASGWNQQFYTTQVYEKWLGDLETYSQDTVTNSLSKNFNLQLDYDNGGNLTATVRAIRADAHQLVMNSYFQFTDSDGTGWVDPTSTLPPTVYVYPTNLGGDRVFSPNGFAPNTVPVTVNMNGSQMSVSVPANLQAFLANQNNYILKTTASQNDDEDDATMTVGRFDGHYKFGDSGFKIDFGGRYSDRSSSFTGFGLAAPVYGGNGASDPGGCYVQWKAADVVLNGGGVAGACTAGDSQGYFRSGTLSALNPSQLPALIRNNMILDSAAGVSFYNLNPAAMDNVLGFQNALYPGEVWNINPGDTWQVAVHQPSTYVQGDFSGEAFGVPFSGNVGTRVIRTNLYVTQHAVGAAQPYGLNSLDAGSIQTNRSFTDVLPTFNVAFDLTQALKLRLAYAKNMQLLNLDQWGGGLQLSYGIDPSLPPGVFRVLGGSSSGNPQLNPWRSSNYDVSLEYYANRSTLVSLAFFYVDVTSFIVNGSTMVCSFPDSDGVSRNHCVSISGPTQGAGAGLRGLEFGLKESFDFLPGILANFGTALNFTYSPSNTGRDLAGNEIPFQDNSARQANVILFYQDRRVQARIAGNYRSKRAASQNFGGITGLEEYQAPTFYLDASASYSVTANVEAFIQATNLTNEYEKYYLVWPDQVADTTHYERRFALGVRARF